MCALLHGVARPLYHTLMARSQRANAKATSLRWVLSIFIVLSTLSESKSERESDIANDESDVANEWVHDPFEATSLSRSLSPNVNEP